MGKVKDKFFDYAEDNFENELQMENALMDEDFSIINMNKTDKNKNQTTKIIDLNISNFLSDDYFDKILQKASFENNVTH